VIDLGGYRLQVVEACNGLRYLFPGLSFGLLMAYLFHAPLWQRVLLFVSTVPVVVLMNSLRIGVIGVLVEHFGVAMAEGFLHDFEGWVVFMACIGVLFVEMWALARLSGRRRLRTYFGLPPTAAVAPGPRRRFPLAFAGAGALLLGLAASSHALGTRTELAPPLTPLASFPLHSGAWSGEMSRLEDIYLSALDLTDYLLGNYRRADGGAVNLYVAYYRSQRSGHSAHSPRACIPGGGWEIRQVTRIPLPGLTMARQPLRVNRVEIQAGDARQLVYYWFQQRGRVITSEYMVKWYLFRDALIRRRTDGALVRATTALAPGEPWAAADARLTDFLAAVQSPLDRYLPD
jgi:exosortase D (VPLPA-CTERM-specific)